MAQLLKYEKLFQLSYEHAFYDKGYNANAEWLRMLPTEQTALLIRDGRMKFVATKYGAILFYQAEANGTPLVNIGPQLFSFALYAANKTEFLRETLMDVGGGSYTPGKVLMFANVNASGSTDLNNPEALNAELKIAPQTKLFNYEFNLSAASSTGEVIVENTNIAHKSLDFTIGKNNQQLDLRNHENKKYTVVVKKDASTILTEEEIYIDRNLSASGPIGMLEISPKTMYETYYYKLIFAEP